MSDIAEGWIRSRLGVPGINLFAIRLLDHN